MNNFLHFNILLKMKILIILIDGIGDIGKETPLMAAKIPNMDLVAKTGINGVMDPVETGLACGSDTAHMSLFGYNPFTLYR